jgi:hypothetical protein
MEFAKNQQTPKLPPSDTPILWHSESLLFLNSN